MAKSPDTEKREDDNIRRMIQMKPKPHPKAPSAKKSKKAEKKGA
jgi:hypothetical protein